MFSVNNGLFTVTSPGLYQFFVSVTFQQPITFNRVDGERIVRLRRSFSNSSQIEHSFIGQYQYVPPSSIQSTTFTPFYTLLSVSASLPMLFGDTVQVELYQNNTQNIALHAYLELNIVKISDLPSNIFTNDNIKIGPTDHPLTL